RLDDAITQGLADLQSHYTDWEPLWNILKVKGPEGLDKTRHPRLAYPHTRALYHKASSAWRERPQIVQRLYVALGVTVADIALCFIALPFTHHLARSRGLGWTVLGVAVVLGLTSLGFYVRLIVASVTRPE